MAKMSKEMPIEVFAKKVGINKKEQDWIVKNDKDTHYVNNSALKNSWLSLSYPIYDGDYYFAFIHKNPRVNAQYNAKANRELRKYIKSTLSADDIFDKMEDYFAMQFKNAGSGDTMTREELWTAIVDARKKNPVKEELGEGKGTDIFKKYGSIINRLSDKEKDEVIELLYQMNSQSGKQYKQAFSKVKELLNMEYIPEEKVELMSQGWANAFGKSTVLDEAVADITVDPKNRINSGQQQAYHGMEIAKQARRMGLKSAVMHKHVRIKGAKKAVNDFLRIVIGKSRYGDPTEKDMSTPQVDKMLTKGLK